MMKKYISIYSALLTSIVLIATPLSSQADSDKDQMMNDDNRGEMMGYRGRHSENYMPMGRGMGHGYMGRGYGGMMGGGMGHGGSMHGMRSRINTIGMLDLDSKQRTKIRAIQREQRKSRWQTMGQMMDEKDKLLDLYNTGNRDKEAIGKVYSKIFDLKQQMIEANIDAGNKARAILNEKQ
ncbi:MAG: periplasmic heavy metal sensor, partial [Gammaproteobacteria bacterium]|nr:periplasmic heavy metal sensor [Gammaproteobacteria bacterium]